MSTTPVSSGETVTDTLKLSSNIESGLYNSDQNLSLSVLGSENSKVYYTLDGSIPSETSEIYNSSKGISVTDNVVIKALAISKTGKKSSIVILEISVDKAPPIAEASLDDAETYTDSKNLALTSSEANSEIYYTVDGSDPTENSTPYSNAIALNGDTIVSFFAKDKAGNKSPIKKKFYKFNLSPPPAPVDTTPPKLYCTFDEDHYLSERIYVKANPTIRCKTSDDSGFAQISYYKKSTGEWIDTSGTFLVEEEGLLKIRARDQAGNEATRNNSYVEIDSEPPSIVPKTSPGKYYYPVNKKPFNIEITVTDVHKSLSGLAYMWDSGSNWTGLGDLGNWSSQCSGNTGNLTCSIPFPYVPNTGDSYVDEQTHAYVHGQKHFLTITAHDMAGNSQQLSKLEYVIIDAFPPFNAVAELNDKSYSVTSYPSSQGRINWDTTIEDDFRTRKYSKISVFNNDIKLIIKAPVEGNIKCKFKRFDFKIDNTTQGRLDGINWHTLEGYRNVDEGTIQYTDYIEPINFTKEGTYLLECDAIGEYKSTTTIRFVFDIDKTVSVEVNDKSYSLNQVQLFNDDPFPVIYEYENSTNEKQLKELFTSNKDIKLILKAPGERNIKYKFERFDFKNDSPPGELNPTKQPSDTSILGPIIGYRKVDEQQGQYTDYLEPINFTKEGTYIVIFYVDVEDKTKIIYNSVRFNIDKTVPDVQLPLFQLPLVPLE